MTLRAIVAASVMVFLAAAGYIMTGAREPPVAVASRAIPAAEMSPAGIPAAVAVAAPGIAASAAGPAETWKPQDLPAVVAQRWREAKDKRAFFDRAVAVGGGAHLHFALEALQRCRSVNDLGMVGAEQEMIARIPASDLSQARRLDAHRAFIQGCDGFGMRRVTDAEVGAITRRIYEQPDAVGKAYSLMSYPDSATEYDEVRATALELVETRDPYVLQILMPHLAGRRLGNLTWSQFMTSDATTERLHRELGAWSWALCELGIDCTGAGAYGDLQCFAVGKCDWKAVDEVAPALFGSGATRAMPARKDEIVAAVRARDWARLGF